MSIENKEMMYQGQFSVVEIGLPSEKDFVSFVQTQKDEQRRLQEVITRCSLGCNSSSLVTLNEVALFLSFSLAMTK